MLLGHEIDYEDTRPDDYCTTEPHDKSTGVAKIDLGVDIATPPYLASRPWRLNSFVTRERA